jgi:hypothetical protein
MCWSPSKFFIVFILPAFVCELSCDMHSSRSLAMKQTARRAIGTECQSCGKMFGTTFSYDQHRRSAYLRGTACYALPNETRVVVTAAPRPNMSTAVLERRLAKRTRGGGRIMPYFCIFSKGSIFCILIHSQKGPTSGG